MPVITKKDFEDRYQVQIEFKLSASLLEDPVAKDFLHEISGLILARYDDDENGEEAGKFHVSLVQFNEAMKAGIDTLSIGDGISGEVAQYWECLFDMNSGHLKPDIRVEYDTVGCNLLIIDFIEVYPKFRGHGIGLAGVQRIVDVFGGGCALVACTPYPLQFTPAFISDPDKLEKLQPPESSREEGIRKLQEYWSKAGFRPVGRSGIYVRSVGCTGDVTDSIGGVESFA